MLSGHQNPLLSPYLRCTQGDVARVCLDSAADQSVCDGVPGAACTETTENSGPWCHEFTFQHEYFGDGVLKANWPSPIGLNQITSSMPDPFPWAGGATRDERHESAITGAGSYAEYDQWLHFEFRSDDDGDPDDDGVGEQLPFENAFIEVDMTTPRTLCGAMIRTNNRAERGGYFHWGAYRPCKGTVEVDGATVASFDVELGGGEEWGEPLGYIRLKLRFNYWVTGQVVRFNFHMR